MLFILLLLAILAFGIYLSGQRIIVSGSSMWPTLAEGDVLLVDRISYHFTGPGRFDVVVFPSRYQEDTVYIRRVIGKPGETIQIVNGTIYINGNLLKETLNLGDITNAGLAIEPVTMGADEYFVLCDNRDDGSDSREPSIGPIKLDEFQGKAVFVMWPLNHMKYIRK